MVVQFGPKAKIEPSDEC